MLDDLTFLHGNHRPCCVASVDKRFEYHTLQLMTSGTVQLWYGQRRFDLSGAWTWPCFPGPRVRFHPWPAGQPWDHRYLAFNGPRVAVWQADGLWPPEPQPVSPPAVDPLAGLFDQLIGLAMQPGRWSRLRAVNLLERALLERAEASHAPVQPRPAWLATVIHALSSTEGDDPDYQHLARSVNLSLTTLRRRFRAATGQTLHRYRLECRIAHARRWLGETDEPIKQIAARLGYRDVFYFTRQFTQLIGVPPAAYRRSRQ